MTNGYPPQMRPSAPQHPGPYMRPNGPMTAMQPQPYRMPHQQFPPNTRMVNIRPDWDQHCWPNWGVTGFNLFFYFQPGPGFPPGAMRGPGQMLGSPFPPGHPANMMSGPRGPHRFPPGPIPRHVFPPHMAQQQRPRPVQVTYPVNDNSEFEQVFNPVRCSRFFVQI